MIGTNNTGQVMQESDETASGIKAIVDLLQDRRPEMKILLLGVFPRSINSNDPQRIRNREVNEKIKGLADSKNIHFLDISNKFLNKDGKLPKDIMPDALHPNARGYEIWASSIEEKICEIGGWGKVKG
jgi:lysophospholipase L1-like esterase